MSGAPNLKFTPPVRRPVGVGADEDGDPIVACDDGTVWKLSCTVDHLGRTCWYQLPPIPGTLADQPAKPVDPAQVDLLAQLRQEAYERVGSAVAALRQALIGDVRSPLVDDLSQAVAALVTHMERKP